MRTSISAERSLLLSPSDLVWLLISSPLPQLLLRHPNSSWPSSRDALRDGSGLYLLLDRWASLSLFARLRRGYIIYTLLQLSIHFFVLAFALVVIVVLQVLMLLLVLVEGIATESTVKQLVFPWGALTNMETILQTKVDMC